MKKWIMICTLMMAMVFSGCSNAEPQQKENETSQTTQQKEEIQAVTSFYPIYILALNVTDGVENVKLTNLTGSQTGCLHDYQLTTDNMKTLSEADLLMINGIGMEGFLDKVIKENPSLEVLDTSEGAFLLEAKEAQEDEDNHGKYNSHIWLSIPNAVKQAENIRDAFCRLDPDNEEKYKKNTKEFTNAMKELTDQMKSIDLTKKQNAAIFHQGFEYFSSDFGFDVAFRIDADEDTTPSAKEVKEAVEKTKEQNISVFFAANDIGKQFADTIAEETGAKVYVLDPITSGEYKKDAYEKAMQNNIRILKEALDK